MISKQVEQLEKTEAELKHLCGSILATLEVNLERGAFDFRDAAALTTFTTYVRGFRRDFTKICSESANKTTDEN